MEINAKEIFVLVEECEGGWRELITAHQQLLEEATQDAKAMRKLGHKISVECIILHKNDKNKTAQNDLELEANNILRKMVGIEPKEV